MSEFEKKSERIEIRVSHSKKQAFNQACETSGDTTSSALRRFIDSYIRRADGDAFADGFRAMGRMAKRRWFPLSTVAALLLVGGYFTGQALKPTPQDGPIVTASTDDFPPIDYALFAAYDKNANGVLDLGEVAENDEHLHRVLNLDGEAGISPAEFYTTGDMDWNFIQKGSTVIAEGAFTDEGEHIPTTMTKQAKGELPRIVVFDLTDASAPSIQVSSPTKGEAVNPKDIAVDIRRLLPRNLPKDITVTTRHPERSVSWERGKSVPALSFSNHEYRVRGVRTHKAH